MSAGRILVALGILGALASQALPAEIAWGETLIVRTVQRQEPIEGESYFVHTWVLDLVGVQPATVLATKAAPAGTPAYRIVHVSEGPYEAGGSAARVGQIASGGLMIGTKFWPLALVQRVEVRSN